MNIEDWEIKRFIVKFSKVPMFEALSWLEDRGCYHSATNTNCELMRDLCNEYYSYGAGLPRVIGNTTWAWAKSAALEELEKLNRESDNDV